MATKKAEKKPAAMTAKKKPVAKKTTKKKAGVFPQVVTGTHLTVTTYEDGRTELMWDDEQLLKEVREAIASSEFNNLKPAVKAKVATRKKKVS